MSDSPVPQVPHANVPHATVPSAKLPTPEVPTPEVPTPEVPTASSPHHVSPGDATLSQVTSGKALALKTHLRRLKAVFPVLFFIGGFAWDAVTIGQRVMRSDIAIFSAYVLVAGWILHQISTPASAWARLIAWCGAWPWLSKKMAEWPVQDWPYWVLQFLFGSLLSALFILYFKSSSNSLAWLLTLLLGVLLVANEFLESEYRRLTLCWSMFGLCTMLLFNFALPYLLGSVHPVWFYTSTLLGALASVFLYRHAPKHSGSIWPVGVLALLLMVAYRADMIPPVPLVKQAVVVGYAIEKTPTGYWITLQKSPWWQVWRVDSDALRVNDQTALVCFSAVFAPQGLRTRLIHRWQKLERDHWVDYGSPGFALAGGRDGGYRGYTTKSHLSAGQWRVRIQTEAGQTIAIHHFSVQLAANTADNRVRVRY